MSKQQLTKENGDTFLIVERMPDNAYILAHWVGIQTLASVQKGGTYYLQMLKQQPCSKLLNSHEELIGPWTVAVDWIEQEWTPQVRSLGLRYMAQVLAPGVYGQMSFKQLQQRIDDKFEIRLFNSEQDARQWLLELPD